ncbi:MAG: RNase H family protein, partial [Flavobacteriales bacterium]
MSIRIYTDGSAKGNPGPGGYGIVLLSDEGHRKEVAKGYRKTTNNRMELLSVIIALEMLKARPMDVVVYSDS